MHMIRGVCVALVLSGIVARSGAVELESLRARYYPGAQLMGDIESSISGMFWDDIRGKSYPHPRFWPDTAREGTDYWHLAPGVRLLTPLSRADSSWSYRGRIHSDIRFGQLLVRNSASINPDLRDDPNYPYNRKRGSAGYWEEAYFQLDNPLGFVRLGRLKRNWGPFVDRSLIVSSNPLSYDALEWKIAGPFFEFRHLFGSFARKTTAWDVHSTPEPPDSRANPNRQRWLGAHALNFMLGKWGSVGILEGYLMTTAHGLPELQALNPFGSYTLMSTNAEMQGNAMLGFQWHLHPFTPQVSLLGQIVIDDLQVDNESQGDQEPNHWGADVGVHWRQPVGSFPLRHALALEYTYVSRWMYLVSWNNTWQGERWTYLRSGLGMDDNDFDRWHLRGTVAGNDWWEGTIAFSYGRKGVNSVTSPWNTPRGDNDYRRETILRSDSATHILEQSLCASVYLAPYGYLDLGVTNAWTRRGIAESDGWEYGVRLYAGLSLWYPNLFIPFPGRGRE